MGLPVKVYNEGMKLRAGTIEYFFEALVEHLTRGPKDDQGRQQIEAEKKALHDAFVRIALAPEPARSYEQIKADYKARRKRIEVEPEPLPPLPPGKARVVSF